MDMFGQIHHFISLFIQHASRNPSQNVSYLNIRIFTMFQKSFEQVLSRPYLLSRRLCFLNVTKSKRFFLSVLQLNTIFSAHISSFKMIWKPSNSLPFEFSEDICIGSKNSAEAKICESDFRPRFPLRITLLYI